MEAISAIAQDSNDPNQGRKSTNLDTEKAVPNVSIF
jgi:hypothetical protein